ncbi:MAG: hypothetical protein ACP5JJ_10660 [Anaerolineae bacterium]
MDPHLGLSFPECSENAARVRRSFAGHGLERSTLPEDGPREGQSPGMVTVIVAQVDVEPVIVEVVEHPVEARPGSQDEAQLGNSSVGGLSQIVGTASVGIQNDKLLLQTLLSVRLKGAIEAWG